MKSIVTSWVVIFRRKSINSLFLNTSINSCTPNDSYKRDRTINGIDSEKDSGKYLDRTSLCSYFVDRV